MGTPAVLQRTSDVTAANPPILAHVIAGPVSSEPAWWVRILSARHNHRRRVERGHSQERVAYDAHVSRCPTRSLRRVSLVPDDPANSRLQTQLAKVDPFREEVIVTHDHRDPVYINRVLR